MTKKTTQRIRSFQISADDRPTATSASRSSRWLVWGAVAVLTFFIVVALFVLNDKQIFRKAPENDRQRVAALYRVAANAVQTLNQEPCHRTAIIQLLQAYETAHMTRAFVREISQFEQSCAPLPEVRYDQVQALLLLSEFKAALPVVDALVAENLTEPDAWATRAEVKEQLGDLAGASHDLRQALALFPDPSKVGASSWYRLTEVLSRQGLFCEAVGPLQTFVSFDPTARRTQQISTLLFDLRRKGNCVQNGGPKNVSIRFPIGASALVVDAEINGVSGRFIVDTGASAVAVTHEFSIRAHLPIEQSETLTVNTANGPARVQTSYADTISLGGLSAQKVSVLIHPPSDHGFGGKIDGLLGLSFIGNFDFHFQNGVLVLATPQN